MTMFALIPALIGLSVFLISKGFKVNEPLYLTSDGVVVKHHSSPRRVERSEVKQAPLTEVPSGDPRIRNFVDAKGRRAKMIRSDEAGRPVLEIDYRNGEELKMERLFAQDGKLVRERRFRNDRLMGEETFR